MSGERRRRRRPVLRRRDSGRRDSGRRDSGRRGSGRRLWSPPIPPRRTDRVEDLSAWLLVTLGLLAVLGAVVVGRGAHDAALRGVGTAIPLRVTLLADAPDY